MMIIRRKKSTQQPNSFGERISIAIEEPSTSQEAMSSENATKWNIGIEREMCSLHGNEVWDPVDLPKDHKAVGNKRVFKLMHGYGTV